MIKKVLITGCNGFVGSYLAKSYLDDNYLVYGIDLHTFAHNSKINYTKVDLSEKVAFEEYLNHNVFSEICHLAAIANPRESNKNPQTSIFISVNSTVLLLEHCRRNPETRLLIVGSSEEYKKKSSDEIYYNEHDPLNPDTIYGVSKVVSELITDVYIRNYNIKALFTRSFNHTGPGQSTNYVLSSFAQQVALIKSNLKEKKLLVGNIDVKRDFLDVRDVVSAYRKILIKGKPGETYNVSSDTAVSLRNCLLMMFNYINCSSIDIQIDPNLVRNNEPKSISGDNSKLKNDTGWFPTISLEKTLKDLIDYWYSELN